MIFSHTLELVLSGVKMQSRRLKKPTHHLIVQGDLVRVESITTRGRRIMYQVGKTYAVQPGRTQKAVAYIRLTGLREETVQDISEADARAEGFESREAFFAAWHTIHGQKAKLTARVWVLTFQLYEGE